MSKKKNLSTDNNFSEYSAASIIDNSVITNSTNGVSMTIINNSVPNSYAGNEEEQLMKQWQQFLKDLTLIGESYPDNFSLAQHRENAWNR